MNLHRYEAFLYVCEHHGIEPASRAMPWSVGRTAVSKQMKIFEGEQGGLLFVRKPFRLLPRGQQIYDEIAPLYRGIERLMREVAGLAGPLVRIGASEFIQEEYVIPLLPLLHRHHPNLRLQFLPGGTEQL